MAECTGPRWTNVDTALTVLVPIELAAAYLVSLRIAPAAYYHSKDGSTHAGPDASCTPLLISELMELAAYITLLAHTVYGYVGWEAPHQNLQLASLVVSVALVIMATAAVAASSVSKHDAYRFVATALFTAQTLLSVYQLDLPLAARVASPVLCAAYFCAFLADVARINHPGMPRCVKRTVVALMVVGPSTYALPMWSNSC